MKKNILTNMIQYTKVIGVVAMLLGISVSAWGAKTGTIYFGNSSGHTQINDYSVNGNDDQGNTWSIETVTSNTKSFTQSSNYSQVGSSSYPVTSITFTMTLPFSKSITSFSAKFGGFSGTAGDITLKVGSTTVGSGSLSGTSDVTVSNSTSAEGKVLTVTVTSIAKGVKCYYISYTYSNTAKYTVTYDAEGGTCGTASETESTIDGGVVLPSATANAASYGWGFYGWATSAVDDPTTTTPTIVGKAGDTYYPDEDVILTAVYAKGEYTKITSTSDLNSTSKYIFAAVYSSKNYVMTSKYASQKLAAEQIDETSSGKYAAALMNASWCFTLEANSTYWHIKDCNSANTDHYLDTYYTEWYGHAKDNADPYTFTWSTDHWTIQNKYTSGDRYFGYSNSDEAFKTYSTAQELQIYKETVTPTYCSDPSTVRLVASPAAGGSVVFDDNSSAEMDFATDDGYIGDITATPNSGYDFLNWVSSDDDVATVDVAADATTEVTALGSATLTAYFYQNHSITYTLSAGVTGEGGNPATITKAEMDGFSSGFNLAAHYKNMTLTSVTMGGSPLTEGAAADYEWELDDGFALLTIHHDNIDGDIVITVSATPMEYTKYAFSCAELTLTPVLVTAGTPIFITSTASKTVRSQDYIEITGNGLTPSTELTFPDLPAKFAIKNADGTALATNSSGVIEEDAYIFYTPDAGDTSDGLDKLTGITVSVGGAKPKTVNLTQSIIGRHLPANFVIAAKNTTDNKWYALPANMSSADNPVPSEIAVNDIDNPTIAYTANSNYYSLYGNDTKQYIQFGMTNNVDGSSRPYALWANNSDASTKIGKSSGLAENSQGANYQWLLTQTNTDITNPQDAKYTISNPNNANALKLWMAAGGVGNPKWGLYASGINELRLIPASDVVFTEAEIVAWGQHKAIVEVDKANAGGSGVAAAKVKAKLNGEVSSLIDLAETKTSNGTGATKYDYTVAFGDVIDFADAANAGQMLTLEWYNSSDVLIAVSNIIIPTIVASNITINKTNYSLKSAWNTEVHVLPNVTVTVEADYSPNPDVTINELNIYPGATVNVTTGTLKATTLVMRNGWDRLSGGDKKYDVARLYITPTNGNLQATNAYADWYIDYDQYYPIAVPWDVTVADMSYLNTTNSASAGVKFLYYDGASRAANVQAGVGSGANWKLYGDVGCNAVPTTLTPGIGYAMTARRPTGKAFSIIRMPLTIPSADWTTAGEKGEVSGTHKDQVTVTAYGNASTPSYAKGWNLIANPYMSLHQGALSYTTSGTIEYANIPDIDFKEYDQQPIAVTKLKPASAFLVQAPQNGTVTFGEANRKPSAPSYRREVADETMPIQRAYITLANNEAEDMMGILVGGNYTAEYETNADLEKLLSDGNTLRTYMRYGDMNMAYVAINEMLAKEWIPVSVRIPADGEYKFALHEASIANNLEGIYLIDYGNGGVVTNLLDDDYIFYTTAGTNTSRFAINAIAGKRDTPTDIDLVNIRGDGTKPVKFIYQDKMYILQNGIIYDATGKKVKEVRL